MSDKLDGPTIDLGDGHGLRPLTLYGSDEVCGYIEYHRNAQGQRCMGSVWLEGKEAPTEKHPRWRVVNADPLTLEPSILCRVCGNHGWVRDGRWVNA